MEGDENSWCTGGHKHLRVRFIIILLASLRGIQTLSVSHFWGADLSGRRKNKRADSLY